MNHEVQTRNSISVVDRNKNMDHRFGLGEIVDSGIREKGASSSRKFRSTESRRELAHGRSLWSHQGGSLAWRASICRC
jgi:hypothetical protein